MYEAIPSDTPTAEMRKDARRRRSFDIYLDDAGGYDLLSADQERAKAQQVSALRVDYWCAVLSCPSIAGRIFEVIGERCSPVPEGLAAAQQALDALRQSESSDAAAKLVEAVGKLAAQMTEVDPDNNLLEELGEEISHLGARETGPLLRRVELPAEEVVRRYAVRVRRARRLYVRSRNRFVCSNLRLVVKIAQRYGRNRMSLADRVQEGNLGLLKAIDRFDPDRGVRFSTYAGWWIRHSVTRALVNRARTVRIPAHLHTIFTKVRGVRKTLHGELGREPTLEEVSKAIDTPVEKVKAAIDAMELRSVGLEAPVAGEDSPTVFEGLADDTPNDWGENLDSRRHIDVAARSLRELDPMERDILAHRFELAGRQKLTLQKLGEKYSLSRERIRQLQNRALAKLRMSLEESKVPSYNYA